MPLGERIHGLNADAAARRASVLALLEATPAPLSEELIWLRAKPRMTRIQTRHAIKVLRAEGKIQMAHRKHSFGRDSTYRLVVAARESA